MMIRILVVDDHPVVREGLVVVLGDREDFQVVGSAGSGEEAIRLAADLQPDVALLDLELPGMHGTQVLPELLRAAPGCRVLVFTAYSTEECVLGAIRGGARGYLLKGAPAEEIARAIGTLHAGGSHLVPEAAAKVLTALDGSARKSALTEREREVLRLAAGGLSNKQIARSLGITERTVKFHLSSTYAKLDADNRASAVARAIQLRLV